MARLWFGAGEEGVKERGRRGERERELKVQSVLNDQSTEVSYMIELTNQNTEM